MLIPDINIDIINEYLINKINFCNDPKFKITIMETLDFFHKMFVQLFENLQNNNNFIEILFTCPLTKKLAMEACPTLCQNYQSSDDIIRYINDSVYSYKNIMWPGYKKNEEPIFLIFSSLEYQLLEKIIGIQEYFATTDMLLLRDYIIEYFQMAGPLTYENIKDKYDRECKNSNFCIKWCQYGDNKINFSSQLNENMIIDINQYFSELFDDNTKIINRAHKPQGVKYILGDFNNDIEMAIDDTDIN